MSVSRPLKHRRRGALVSGRGEESAYEEPHARAQGGRCEPVDAGNVRLDGTTGTASHDECVCRNCRAVRSEAQVEAEEAELARTGGIVLRWGGLGGGMACSRQLRLAWKLQWLAVVMTKWASRARESSDLRAGLIQCDALCRT